MGKLILKVIMIDASFNASKSLQDKLASHYSLILGKRKDTLIVHIVEYTSEL